MMDRDDIARLGDETLVSIKAHPPADARRTLIRITSGTSGRAPIVLASSYDSGALDDVQTGATFRTISCLGTRCIRLSNVLAESTYSTGHQNRWLPLDAADLSDPRVATLLDDFKPNRFYGLSSLIARAGRVLTDATASNIRMIRFSGEGTRDPLLAYFTERFPNAERLENYIANEVGGFVGRRSCKFLPHGHFHVGEGVTVEIDAPDRDGVGDILVSRTLYGPIEAERYRIGDIGRFVPGVCACGEPLTLQLLGRRGSDYIKLGGMLFRREEFDRVIARFPDLIDDYRVRLSERTERGTLRVSAELIAFRKAGRPTDALAHELAERISADVFVTPTRTFAQLVAAGNLDPLELRFSDTPFLPEQKDVKLLVVE